MRTAPVVIVPLSNRDAYLDRYAEPDKGWTDRDEDRWPVPYWHIDTGMAALLILQTAVDEGLGACFFGIPPDRIAAFKAEFGVPEEYTPDRRDHRRPPHRGHRPGRLGRTWPASGRGGRASRGLVTPRQSIGPRRPGQRTPHPHRLGSQTRSRRGADMDLHIDAGLPEPPYAQLREEVRRRVVVGELAPGTRLPPVRKLAEDLGLAPNTVAKAYRELEHLGVIETRGRAGSFVSGDGVGRAAREAAQEYADRVTALGVDAAEAVALVATRARGLSAVLS